MRVLSVDLLGFGKARLFKFDGNILADGRVLAHVDFWERVADLKRIKPEYHEMIDEIIQLPMVHRVFVTSGNLKVWMFDEQDWSYADVHAIKSIMAKYPPADSRVINMKVVKVTIILV